MTFQQWYMQVYLDFDDLFIISAKVLGITYHEFVLISLCVVWPIITVGLVWWCIVLSAKLRTTRKLFTEYCQS